MRKTSSPPVRRRPAPWAVVAAVLVFAGLAAWLLWRPASLPRLTSGTNVVVITLDTVRADRLTPYGFAGIETPALDRLAREGVLFEHAYTPAPLTFPAHASLFTGLIPAGVGVRDNSGFRVADDVPTLAEVFKRLNYRTGAFVSAFVLDGRTGLKRGFDRYRDEFPVRVQDLTAMARIQRPGEETWAAAREWLGEAPNGPFFLWVHFYDAHTPYAAPEPFRSRYPATPYEAEVAHVDALVGQVVAELERLAIADRTLIVVAGDHGEGLGEHGEDEHGLLLYDSTLRVPLIVRFPDQRYAGVRVQQAVGLVDVFPSLLDLFQQPVARPVDGHSVLPSLEAPDAIDGPALFAETLYPQLQFGWSELQSVRTARLKYIRAPQPELYDYRADPQETRTDAARLEADVASLEANLTAMTAGRAGGTAASTDRATTAALRTLGYVAGGSNAPATAGPLADPKDKVAVYRRLMSSRAALDKGDETEGLRTLETLLDDEPRLEAAHQTYRDYFLGRKRAADVIARLRTRLARQPGDAPLLRDLAEAQRSLGQRREALASLEAAVTASPDYLPAIVLAGDLLADDGQYEAARRRFERAIELDPRSGDLAMKLAKTHLQLREPDAAEQLINAVLADSADVSGAHYLRALVAEARGNGIRAETEYRQELALHPWDYQARFNLAQLLGARRAFAEQIELLDSIPALAPDFHDVHFYRAKAYLDAAGLARRQDIVAAATQGLREALESPIAPLGHYVLADLYNLEGRSNDSAREIALARALEARNGPRR